jgi:catechol 2,3-dioxygenase-like lactoylglutathione lyase family enzyme
MFVSGGSAVPTRLIRIVFNALDVDAQARFWRAALGWPAAEDPPGDGRRVGPRGGESHLLFVPSDEPKMAKNRLHLDLAGRPDQAREVDRLIGMGAARAYIGQGQVPWEVLADPEGNEFCVLAEADPYAAEWPLAVINLDATNPAAQGRFWAAVTGWPVVAQDDRAVVLRSPSGTGPVLMMGPPVAPKLGQNRLHLDVAPWRGEDPRREVSRLLHAGACRTDADHRGASGQMLADPEGNEFCVLAPG